METLVFEKPEQVVSQMNSGDRDKDLAMVNAVLSGNVKIENKEETKIEESKIEDSPIEPSITDELSIELERQRLYNELIEKRRVEELEEISKREKEKEELLKKERKEREELEKKLRELEQFKNQNNTNVSQSTDEDEEYVNDYTKKTRQMVEELKRSIGSENPKVQQLIEEISYIKQDYEKEKFEREKFQKDKQAKENREKFFDSIRVFLTDKPDLKPSKDISEIDKEYKQFREDIAYITKAKSIDELESAIEDYKRGGKIKELADANGIKPVSEVDKYNSIVELIDFKEGVKYDSKLGKHIPILDDNGVQVRYRSLDEAYKIKNYYENLTNIKRQTFKEINDKLNRFNAAPIVLKEEQTDTVNTGLSLEQEREILNMNPREWASDPEKKKLVDLVYMKRGLTPPKFRGR